MKCWRCGKTLTSLEEKACEVGRIEKPICSSCSFELGVKSGWIKFRRGKEATEMSFLGIKSRVKRGWSYMGRVLLIMLPVGIQSKLAKVGSTLTVDMGDRYIRYENNLQTASGRPLIDFYRRFKPRGWSKLKEKRR